MSNQLFEFSDDKKVLELLELSEKMNVLCTQCGKLEESTTVGMLRVSLSTTIAKLQIKGVFPRDFHINNGNIVRHLENEDTIKPSRRPYTLQKDLQ